MSKNKQLTHDDTGMVVDVLRDTPKGLVVRTVRNDWTLPDGRNVDRGGVGQIWTLPHPERAFWSER